jgi:hypothetical protein
VNYFGGFGWPGFFTPVVSYAPLPNLWLLEKLIMIQGPETGERLELICQDAVTLAQGWHLIGAVLHIAPLSRFTCM